MLTEKSFDTGELKLNYGESESSGSPMVLLHGLSAWWHQWEYVISCLTEYHVYAVDLRGHGNSGRANGHYYLTDYARDIVFFLREQVKEPAILVGHSLGGLTALATAAQSPDALQSLILVDPPLLVRDTQMSESGDVNPWFSWIRQVMQSSSSYDDLLTRFERDLPDFDEVARRALADQIFHLDVGTLDVALANRMLDGYDLADALHRITCPTMLLRGDWDHHAVVREQDAAFVRENLPSVVDVKIPDGSHLFPFEQSELTLSHMRKFLQYL